jgi:uncharacterized protein YjeT (DUF2065 family)
MMRSDICIPAAVVRVVAGALATVVIGIIVAEAPEAWRYIKMETMRRRGGVLRVLGGQAARRRDGCVASVSRMVLGLPRNPARTACSRPHFRRPDRKWANCDRSS